MCMKKYLSTAGVSVLGIALIFSACVNTDYTPPDYEAQLQAELDAMNQTRLTADTKRIDDSVYTKWQFSAFQIDARSGVRYRIVEPGVGDKPVQTSGILMKYSGILFDSLTFNSGSFSGKPFDSNAAPTQYYPLYNLIPGMRTTLSLVPKGTRVQMIIPSGAAYAESERYDPQNGELIIPKNSILFFDVTLLDVYNATQ